jgi:hypothetical protein
VPAKCIHRNKNGIDIVCLLTQRADYIDKSVGGLLAEECRAVTALRQSETTCYAHLPSMLTQLTANSIMFRKYACPGALKENSLPSTTEEIILNEIVGYYSNKLHVTYCCSHCMFKYVDTYMHIATNITAFVTAAV